MGKGYTKRSRGGQYIQRSVGNDKEATRQEQTHISYLEKASQEQKAVRDEYLLGLKEAKKFSRSNYQTTGKIKPQDF